MDQEQKFNVPLDAELDINSNDMLVSAQQPKVAFNRQRYLGSLNQSSIRYEDDGWFAGWWGHNFDLLSSGNNNIIPPLGAPDELIVMKRTSADGAEYYIVKQKDENLLIYFALTGWEEWTSGTGTISRTGDTVTISGTTSKGATVTAELDAFSGAVISYTSSDPTMSVSCIKDGEAFSFIATPGGASSYILIRRNKATYLLDASLLSYSRDATKSTYSMDGDVVFEVMDDGTVTSSMTGVNVISTAVTAPDTLAEVITAQIQVQIDVNTRTQFGIIQKWLTAVITEVNATDFVSNTLPNKSFELLNNEITGASDSPMGPYQQFGTYKVTNVAPVPTNPNQNYAPYVTFMMQVPIWFGFGGSIAATYENSGSEVVGADLVCKQIITNAVTQSTVMNLKTLVDGTDVAFLMTTSIANVAVVGTAYSLLGLPTTAGPVFTNVAFAGAHTVLDLSLPLFPEPINTYDTLEPLGIKPLALPDITPPIAIPTPPATLPVPFIANPAPWPNVPDTWRPQLQLQVPDPAWVDPGDGTTAPLIWIPDPDYQATIPDPNYTIIIVDPAWANPNDRPTKYVSVDFGAGLYTLDHTVRIVNRSAAVASSIAVDANYAAFYCRTTLQIHPIYIFGYEYVPFQLATAGAPAYTTAAGTYPAIPGIPPAKHRYDYRSDLNYWLNAVNYTTAPINPIADNLIYLLGPNAINKYDNTWHRNRLAGTWGNPNITFNLPVSMFGVATVRVDMDAIQAEDIADKYTVISGAASSHWRIDDNNGTGGLNALDIVKVEEVSASPGGVLTVDLNQVATTSIMYRPSKMTEAEYNDHASYVYPPFVRGGVGMESFMPRVDKVIKALIHERHTLGNFIAANDDFSSSTSFPNPSLLTAALESQGTFDNPVATITDLAMPYQAVELAFDANNKVTFRYNVSTKAFDQFVPAFTDYTMSAYTLALNGALPLLQMTMNTGATRPIDFYRTFIIEATGVGTTETIVSQTGNELQLSDGVVDLTTGRLRNAVNVVYDRAEINPITAKVYLKSGDALAVRYIPEGIFYSDTDDVDYISVNGNNVVFEKDGTQYTLTVDPNSEAAIAYTATDIRDGNMHMLYKRDLSDVYMYIKQFWTGDVNVENYWWIDSTHVLELSKYNLTLYRKMMKTATLSDVHDWMGDRWEIEQQAPRSNFFGTQDLYYSVSSAQNGLPTVFKLQVVGNSIRILKIADILTADFADPTWTTQTVAVQKIALGAALSTTAISAYTELSAYSICTTAKISATTVDGTMLIGFALNRGLLQWILFNGTIVNGYGHVGVDGSLTGGMYPTVCVSTNGFNQPVYPLSDLPVNQIEIPNMCYGTGSQVWFVYQEIASIVSHFNYVNGSLQAVSVPLTNNVTSRYESASFNTQYLQDFIPTNMSLFDVVGTVFDSILGGFLGDHSVSADQTQQSSEQSQSGKVGTSGATGGVNASAGGSGSASAEFDTSSFIGDIAGIIAFPNIWILDACYVYFTYINQACGQYAYVWRTATQEQIDDKKTDIDVIFCKSKHSQTFATGTRNTLAFWIDVFLKSITGVVGDPAPYKVNESQNQTAVSDSSGRKYSQFFTENVASTIQTSLVASGFGATMKSSLTEMYSLNMFYSVSDKSQVFAGPGFTNLNFVGQALAQSAADLQVDSKQIGYWVTLKGMTLALLELQMLLAKKAVELLTNLANGLSGVNLGILTVNVPIGTIFATIIAVIVALLNAMIAIQEVMHDTIIPSICDMLGSEVGTGSLYKTILRRDLSVEGIHAYGDKHMSFMWPAFNIPAAGISYNTESIVSKILIEEQQVNTGGKKLSQNILPQDRAWTPDGDQSEFILSAGQLISSYNNQFPLQGRLKNVTIGCYGEAAQQVAPADMAVIEGITTFLPNDVFKNEQIGMPAPTFAPPALHDFMISKKWNLSYTAVGGEVVWVAQDDTKLIDGLPSNIILSDTFCGVASAYTAIEVKDLYDARYLRPYAITPNTIALNINRVNSVHDAKAYHSFDGHGNRIINWVGGSGMDKEFLYQQYAFKVNDHFKRSNITPPSQFFGAFQGPPNIAMWSNAPDNIVNTIQSLSQQKGIENDTPGEQKNLQRFSVPVHSETLSTLPAVVRMLAPYKLHVVEGVTALTTDIRTTQTKYKAPSSVDFNINGNMFRANDEFVSALTLQSGIVAVQDVAPTAGLTFIGATTREAFFYSSATRMYYSFSGSSEITKRDIFNRFRDINDGKWDFVNQEVVFRCLLGDDVIVARLDNNVAGEIYPPNETIYSERSSFKILSMAGGLTYQGPKRFAVNRFVINEHMYPQIVDNKDKWLRVRRLDYVPERDYHWEYEDWDTVTPVNAVRGWTHNAFRFVTAMLGSSEEMDSRFEWEITFAWTEQMEELYEKDEYVCVNLMADTVTQGGTLRSEVTHVFLFKECFTRAGNAGYYTFKFQSNAGIGNRERLWVWADGIIAVESLALYTKQLTQHRTQILHTQIDVQSLIEQ